MQIEANHACEPFKRDHGLRTASSMWQNSILSWGNREDKPSEFDANCQAFYVKDNKERNSFEHTTSECVVCYHCVLVTHRSHQANYCRVFKMTSFWNSDPATVVHRFSLQVADQKSPENSSPEYAQLATDLADEHRRRDQAQAVQRQGLWTRMNTPMLVLQGWQ